ncbi:hypothetical protein [Kitasatospora sp. NPDC057500]|uniref:hypothetical protein n=1 Tax=Kitasatospora sp. NPDC057500 TaxID=3346151 RepID=UPI0036926F3C
MLRKITADDRRDAADALDDLRATLAAADAALPSTGIDWNCASVTGIVLIDLGAAPTFLVRKLTEVIRDGVRARRREAEQQPWRPAPGLALTLNTPDGIPIEAQVVAATGRLVTVRLPRP